MSYELTIEPLGQTVDIEDGQTILDAALRAGIYLPHACCHGLCATCKVQVLDGEVEHGEVSDFALMDFERDEQKCLACCATAEETLLSRRRSRKTLIPEIFRSGITNAGLPELKTSHRPSRVYGCVRKMVGTLSSRQVSISIWSCRMRSVTVHFPLPICLPMMARSN